MKAQWPSGQGDRGKWSAGGGGLSHHQSSPCGSLDVLVRTWPLLQGCQIQYEFLINMKYLGLSYTKTLFLVHGKFKSIWCPVFHWLNPATTARSLLRALFLSLARRPSRSEGLSISALPPHFRLTEGWAGHRPGAGGCQHCQGHEHKRMCVRTPAPTPATSPR